MRHGPWFDSSSLGRALDGQSNHGERIATLSHRTKVEAN
jgi:hypothetical protein